MKPVTVQKKKKPEFQRQEYHIRRKLQRSGWRKPRGFHSKMRKQIKGKHPIVRVGYKNPEAIRESVVCVNNLLELKAAKGAEHKTVVISGAVGTKKRIELVREAKKIGVSLANIPDAEKYLKVIEERLKLQKENRIARVAKKTGKSKKAEKKEVAEKTEAPKEASKDSEKSDQKPAKASKSKVKK